MSTYYHTPFISKTSVVAGTKFTATALNGPLGTLDAAIYGVVSAGASVVGTTAVNGLISTANVDRLVNQLTTATASTAVKGYMSTAHVAKLDNRLGGKEQVITVDSTSLNINWNSGEVALITASTAVATAATAITVNATNAVAGQMYRIKFKQSTAGDVVWTMAAVIRTNGAATFTLTANKWDWMTLYYDSVDGYSGQLATGFTT